jgi:hypothetical protein
LLLVLQYLKSNGTGYLRIDNTHQHHHNGDQKAPSLYSQVKDIQIIRDHISPEGLVHRTYPVDGCLAGPKSTFEEPLLNKIEMISRGNSKTKRFNKTQTLSRKQ